VEWELPRSGLRRARHLYLTVHDGERVVGSRILRRPPARGHTRLRLAEQPAWPVVWGSSFNRARQRSDLARAELS
jgi:hypothetical protein